MTTQHLPVRDVDRRPWEPQCMVSDGRAGYTKTTFIQAFIESGRASDGMLLFATCCHVANRDIARVALGIHNR